MEPSEVPYRSMGPTELASRLKMMDWQSVCSLVEALVETVEINDDCIVWFDLEGKLYLRKNPEFYR